MPTVRHVVLPVDDLEASLAFYRDSMGFAVKFVDAPRYAALDGGGITIALVSGAEDITDGLTSFAVQVDDVDDCVARMVANGAAVLIPASDGPHERRAVIAGPKGQPIILTRKLL